MSRNSHLAQLLPNFVRISEPLGHSHDPYKDRDHQEIQDTQPKIPHLQHRRLDAVLGPWMPSLVGTTDLEVSLRIVRDNAVDLVLDTPFHPRLLVNGPCEKRSSLVLAALHKTRPAESKQRLLSHIHRDVGDLEVFPSPVAWEADVRKGEVREHLVAQPKVFGSPAAEHDSLLPPPFRRGGNRLGNLGDHVLGVVIDLDVQEHPDRLDPRLG